MQGVKFYRVWGMGGCDYGITIFWGLSGVIFINQMGNYFFDFDSDLCFSIRAALEIGLTTLVGLAVVESDL